jgi:hypothetical protein
LVGRFRLNNRRPQPHSRFRRANQLGLNDRPSIRKMTSCDTTLAQTLDPASTQSGPDISPEMQPSQLTPWSQVINPDITSTSRLHSLRSGSPRSDTLTRQPRSTIATPTPRRCRLSNGKPTAFLSNRIFMGTVASTHRPNTTLAALPVAACILAVLFGAAAATDLGPVVLAILAALLLGTASIALYVRDPILAFIWLWCFDVFNAPLSAPFGYFSATGQAIRQGNDVLVLLFVCLTVWRTVRLNTQLPLARFVLPAVGIASLGVLAGILHHVPLTVLVLGGWLGLKFWIMVVITLLLPWKQDDLHRVYRVLTGVGIVVAVFGFIDYATHSGVSHFLHTSITEPQSGGFRGEAVSSILTHPGEFSLLMSLLFAITFARFSAMRTRADLVLAIVFASSVMLSLRLKGFLSLAAVALILALVQGISQHRRGLVVLLVGTLLLVSAFSVEGNVIAKQVSTYTSSESSARSRLYTVGSQLADTDFPLGVGFGRFASYPSRLYYSPIYYEYDLSSIYGLSKRFPNFIDDTSWPSVIGETGYLGFVIYLFGVLVIILAILRSLRTAQAEFRWMPLSTLCVIAVLLVNSLGSPTLFDWLATTGFALLLGPTLIGVKKPSLRPLEVSEAQNIVVDPQPSDLSPSVATSLTPSFSPRLSTP